MGPLIYFLFCPFVPFRPRKRLNSLMDSTIHTPYFISSNTIAVVMSSQQYFVTTYHIALCIIINSKILTFYADMFILMLQSIILV